MILTVLNFIGLFVCVFYLAYEFAMYNVCKYILEALNNVDVDESDQQFLEGVYFITDYLGKKV